MKKTLFTSVFALILGVSAFADNEPTVLPDNATCNEDNLGVSYGSADIEVAWEANTIGTTWYKDGVQITGDDVPSSCTYDTAMNLPEPPSKPGYAFNGWTLRVVAAPEPVVSTCLIPSTDVSNNGNAFGYKNDSTGEYGAGSSNTDLFNLTEDNTWGASWENGDKVTGVALCSAQSGNNHSQQWGGDSSDWTSDESTLTSVSGETRYCWCKATHYTANNAQQCSLSAPAWVFNSANGLAADCAGGCAFDCAFNVQIYSGFRAALFAGNVAQ